jgi:hypothetical protein
MVRELEPAKQQTGQLACDRSVWRLVRLRNIASEQTTARPIKIPSSYELTREIHKKPRDNYHTNQWLWSKCSRVRVPFISSKYPAKTGVTAI